MNAIFGYCCSPAEWETLRRMLDLPLPEEIDEYPLDEENCQSAYDSLCASGILTPAGDRVLVDRLYTFLLDSISSSDWCIACHTESRQAQLYRMTDLMVLCEWTASQCSMTPLDNTESARETLENAILRCTAPLTISLRQGGSTESAAYSSPETASRAALQMLHSFSSLTRE